MPRLGTIELGVRPCIVAAGGEPEVEALATAAGADAVELRADLFDDPSVVRVTRALERLRTAGRPVVLTVRAASEGGRAMPDEHRRELYDAGLPLADAVDVEVASTALAASVGAAARRSRRLLVLSFHDFAATPAHDALVARVDAAFAAGADVAKIATHAASTADLRRLLDVTRAAGSRPIATLAMGPYGPLSRFVLPAAGSLLTYASVGTPTAPGQTTLAELADLVRRLFPA
jgi:3-dehydroquinate dehydratase-1